MNRFVKFSLAALVAASLASGFVGMPALAADDTGTIEISGATAGTYNVYQLFTGTYAAGDQNALGSPITINPTYQSVILDAIAKFNSRFKLDTTKSAEDQAYQIAGEIAKLGGSTAAAYGDNTQEGRNFANYLAQQLKSATPSTTATEANGSISVPNLDTGYYLVAAATANKGSLTSAIMLPVKSGQNTAAIKTSQPTVTKKVTQKGGSAPADYADQGVSQDAVNAASFTITGTLPSNFDDYTKYSYSFTDTLPKGLTTTVDEINADWNVKIMARVEGTPPWTANLTPDFTASLDTGTAGGPQKVTWTASDLKAAFDDLTKTVPLNDGQSLGDAVITLTYTPKYDKDDLDAMYGSMSKLDTPLTNSVNLTYTNDPYAAGSAGEISGTFTTPDSTVKLYSYNLEIHKLGMSAPLSGAKFTLTSADGTSQGNLILSDPATPESDKGVYQFTGLEAGKEYILKETQTPAGFKSIEPIKFTITEEVGADNQTVTSINYTNWSDPSSAAGAPTVTGGTVNLQIVNLPGANMPITGEGGIMFGTVLGVLAIGASSLIIIRRKNMRKTQS